MNENSRKVEIDKSYGPLQPNFVKQIVEHSTHTLQWLKEQTG
jgi:hypothetical protein